MVEMGKGAGFGRGGKNSIFANMLILERVGVGELGLGGGFGNGVREGGLINSVDPGKPKRAIKFVFEAQVDGPSKARA